MKSETAPKGFWPVFKGESFDLWHCDTGEYYAFADPDVVVPWLYSKRLRAGRGGVHSEFSLEYRRNKQTMSCLYPRIAYRRISRATDTRTLRVALVPPKVLLTDVAPVLHW